MNTYKNHQVLIHKTKICLCRRFKGIRIFDRHVGLFYSRKNVITAKGNQASIYSPVKVNKKGMADNWAVLPLKLLETICPVHIEIETKTGKAMLSKDQKIWKSFCETHGWWYILNRDVDETIDVIGKKINQHGFKLF